MPKMLQKTTGISIGDDYPLPIKCLKYTNPDAAKKMKRDAKAEKQSKLAFSQSSGDEVPAKRGKPASRSTTPSGKPSAAKKAKTSATDIKKEQEKLKAMKDSLDDFKK